MQIVSHALALAYSSSESGDSISEKPALTATRFKVLQIAIPDKTKSHWKGSISWVETLPTVLPFNQPFIDIEIQSRVHYQI